MTTAAKKEGTVNHAAEEENANGADGVEDMDVDGEEGGGAGESVSKSDVPVPGSGVKSKIPIERGAAGGKKHAKNEPGGRGESGGVVGGGGDGGGEGGDGGKKHAKNEPGGRGESGSVVGGGGDGGGEGGDGGKSRVGESPTPESDNTTEKYYHDKEASDPEIGEEGSNHEHEEEKTSSDEDQKGCLFPLFDPPPVRLPARPSEWSSRDTRRYRQGYPGKRHYEDSSLNDNYRFYTNEIPYRPYGIRIEEFHEEMWGNYRELEYNHSYIQWLFPIREQGMNWDAQELQPHEIKAILKDQKATERLKRSYKLMLDFYGIDANEEGTQLHRSGNWQERFKNLNRSSHNYLRITCILKCLGEFGMEKQKVCLVEFLLREAIETDELRNVLDSCMCYWVEVLKGDGERERMWRMAQEMVDKVNAKAMERRAVATKHTAKVAPVTRASGYNQQGMGARAATTATGPQDTPPGENKVGLTGGQLGAGRETREVGATGRDNDGDGGGGDREDPYIYRTTV